MKFTITITLLLLFNINRLNANWDSPEILTNQNKTSLRIQQRTGDIGVIALNLLALGLIIHHNDEEGFKEYLYSGVLTSAIVLVVKI